MEKSSIKFTQDFTGDVYGSNIAIDVQTDDDLLCKISRERTYEITKDISNDDIIVLDVDDPTRFLKKPMGKMTSQLWPEYTDVNYLGTDCISSPSTKPKTRVAKKESPAPTVSITFILYPLLWYHEP